MIQQDVKPAIILMAEDSKADQIFMRRAFKKMQILVDFVLATDGKEALKFLRDPTKPQPDLILLDLNMPEIDGLGFLNIRRNSQEPWTVIPVIVLSSSDYPEDVRACYALGANAYLEKMVCLKNLIDVMRTVVRFWLQMAKLPDNEPIMTKNQVQMAKPPSNKAVMNDRLAQVAMLAADKSPMTASMELP